MKNNYSNLVSGFTKLFSTIIHSTVWREDMHVKVVWVTMLAMANRNGKVFASIPGLAGASNVSLDQCLDALGKLAGPDIYSRTKAHEGRRIEECDGGWQLLNYQKYRELRDDDERRIQTREAVKRHRSKKADPLTVSDVSHGKPKQKQKQKQRAEEETHVRAFVSSAPPSIPEDIAMRAGRFVQETYPSLYEKYRKGARYVSKPHLDFQEALELCRVWDDERLAKIATVFLTTDHQFAESGSRTMAQFRSMASWCDGRLAEAGIA